MKKELTPLEIAIKQLDEICCENCSKRVVIKGVSYCQYSGKIILDMTLRVNRIHQCKGRFSILN